LLGFELRTFGRAVSTLNTEPSIQPKPVLFLMRERKVVDLEQRGKEGSKDWKE
jgi:predicted P-loop ATPase/GTPase